MKSLLSLLRIEMKYVEEPSDHVRVTFVLFYLHSTVTIALPILFAYFYTYILSFPPLAFLGCSNGI